jgi:hypothetical protein
LIAGVKEIGDAKLIRSLERELMERDKKVKNVLYLS